VCYLDDKVELDDEPTNTKYSYRPAYIVLHTTSKLGGYISDNRPLHPKHCLDSYCY